MRGEDRLIAAGWAVSTHWQIDCVHRVALVRVVAAKGADLLQQEVVVYASDDAALDERIENGLCDILARRAGL